MTYEDRDTWIKNKLRQQKEIEERTQPNYASIIENFKPSSSLDKQIGGDHYKDCEIQPVEYIVKNNLNFLEGNIIKYTTRHRQKGEGRADIEKVIHYAELILELYYDD
tara:strand:- start:178 stop:501 length:324 start_codon:yes stop_codon:yes gene_type:complete